MQYPAGQKCASRSEGRGAKKCNFDRIDPHWRYNRQPSRSPSRERSAGTRFGTYGSLLSESSNDVKVVQELVRHSKVSTTMEVYTHARMEQKRSAQSRVGDFLFGRGGDAPRFNKCAHSVSMDTRDEDLNVGN